MFRRILLAGAPLDTVEIACASDEHIALVWEKALRHEWPVTLGPGIPATATRPGRALLGFCDWIETDFSASHLRHLLQSGDMCFAGERAQRVSHASGAGSQGPRERACTGVPGVEAPRHGDDEGFSAGAAARTIARAEAGWGRATYALSLGLLEKSFEARAGDPDLSDDEREAASSKAALTTKVRGWVTGLLAAVPEESSRGTVALQDIVSVARAFVGRTTARNSQLDHRAAAALIDHVDELRALGPFECSLREALHFVRERVESLQVAAERPRPGHLYACRLQHAAFSGRPHLFVVGLEEGRVFPAASEDPVLLDAERAAISPALKQSTDRIDEAVYTVLSRLATWSATPLKSQPSTPSSQAADSNGATGTGTLGVGNPPSLRLRRTRRSHGGGGCELGVDAPPAASPAITFSYSCRDTREFRETYASWLMLQAFRLQHGDATLSYQQMRAALGEPVSVLPEVREAAATQSGWWLRSVVGTGERGIEAVEASFDALARGREAERCRDTEEFTPFDGHVPAAGAVLDPCASGRALSVTELEGAAACPYRFFLKRGLGLRPVADGERDRDVWLDPLTRGLELHDIYAALHRRCRAEARRPDVARDGAWLTGYARTALERLNREMPPATAEILARESRDFLADVELFLEAESEASGVEPVGIEVSFGRPLEDDEDDLAREDAVEIDLGGGLRFRVAGRIDRIDKVGPSEFRILDYKTGGFWRDDWKGTFHGGRRLQHALYGLAAVELLRARYQKPAVTGADYYFPSHKGRRERVAIEAPARARTAAVLADLRAVIAEGAFVHAPDADACKFCDYEAACGEGVNDQAEAKLGDAKLSAFGRLAAHE